MRRYRMILESNLRTHALRLLSLTDTVSNTEMSHDYIESRGLENFASLDDLKETTLWCLNMAKIKVKFLQSGAGTQCVEVIVTE